MHTSETTKHKSIFVNLFIALLFLTQGSALQAEGTAFKISRPIPDEFMSQTSKFAADLKHEAVQNWLKRYMKDNYEKVEEQVTPEFTERYILDFTHKRIFKDQPYLLVEGHLDSESLTTWAKPKTMDSENPLHYPLFLISSDHPANSLPPQQTASHIERNVFAKILNQEMEKALARSGMQLNKRNLRSLPALRPVRSRDRLKMLAQAGLAANSDLGLWLHLSSCYRCGGAKLEMYLYRFSPPKVVLTESADLKLSSSQLREAESLTPLLEPIAAKFQERIDESLTKGTLLSSSLKLVVKGLDFTGHRKLENALTKLNFVLGIVPQSISSESGQFEVMTKLDAGEFSRKLARAKFPSFNIKVLSVESNTLVVRYWKPKT